MNPLTASCVALIVCLAIGPVAAVEIVFIDGRVWPDARVVSEAPTSLIVLRGDAVETVHAAELTPECRAALRLRLPTEDELAARPSAAPRAPEEALRLEEPVERPIVLRPAVAMDSSDQPRPVPVAAPVTVREPATVVALDPWIAVAEIWIDGRIVLRAGGGAFVRADGPPSDGRRRPDVGWLEGMIYLQPDSRLNATVRDTPVSGRVVPAGEIRHEGGDGVVHVVAAYRLY